MSKDEVQQTEGKGDLFDPVVYQELNKDMRFMEEIRSRWLGIYISLYTVFAAIFGIFHEKISGISPLIISFILFVLSLVAILLIIMTISHKRSHDTHANIIDEMFYIDFDRRRKKVFCFDGFPHVFACYAIAFSVLAAATFGFGLFVAIGKDWALIVGTIGMLVILFHALYFGIRKLPGERKH